VKGGGVVTRLKKKGEKENKMGEKSSSIQGLKFSELGTCARQSEVGNRQGKGSYSNGRIW